MRGSRGGGGSGPPGNLQSLKSQILLEMKKLVSFRICALPQLNVKVGPPLDPRLMNVPSRLSAEFILFGYFHLKGGGRGKCYFKKRLSMIYHFLPLSYK